MEQKVWKDTKKETIQEKQEVGEEPKMKTKETGLRGWWGQNYVYVVSSLVILVIMLVVMMIKRLWPFGESLLISGDFMLQGWTYLAELREKLVDGESLLYTWNAGYGTNFYSILAYGMVNPITLLYLFMPTKAILKMSAFVYILNLMLCNGSMLFFLSHRPLHAQPKNKISNMLFSLSYALCIYMVSNINNWTFLVCAIFFPLILLGLENFVANKGWKLYFITLAVSFICNYYFTGLFIIFIILYYFTLEFENLKGFFKKSFKILGMSIVALLLFSVFLLPAAIQMMGQSYTVSTYAENTWFTTFFDIFKNFFAFNYVIDRGMASDSYGEVNLYFGLLPLLFATFYFLNSKIKLAVRLKKLCLALLYLLAFNLNGLNYVMHLMHYPTWFPNRFSLFFTLFSIILAYETWISMERTDFKYVTVGKGIAVGLGWTVMTILCFAFANTIQYQFTFTYSIMIFLFYMVAILLLPYLKGKAGKVLVVIGCIELCLNFAFVLVIRGSYTHITGLDKEIENIQTFLSESPVREDNQFYRVLEGKNSVLYVNEGMLYDFKGVSLFSSSIGNYGAFLGCMGVDVAGNVIRPHTYNQATLSLLNVRYYYQDTSLGDAMNMPSRLYTTAIDAMGHYESVYEQGDYILYENPTVLSLGYMIDGKADELFVNGLAEPYERGDSFGALFNEWVEGISGVSDVIEPVPLSLNSIASRNCNAIVYDQTFTLFNELVNYEIQDDASASEIFESNVLENDYDPTDTSTIRFDCKVEEAGEYFVEIPGALATMGYMEAGDEISIYYEMSAKFLAQTGAASSTIQIYRFNEEQWQKAYEILAQHQLQVESYTSASVDGTIQVEEEGILFTSIPYDENWHLYIDGEEREILPLWESSFIAVRLEPGEHTIHLEYRQRGILMGGILSVLALGLTIFVFLSGKQRDFLLEQEMSGEHLETFYSEEILEKRKKKKILEVNQETPEDNPHSEQ